MIFNFIYYIAFEYSVILKYCTNFVYILPDDYLWYRPKYNIDT